MPSSQESLENETVDMWRLASHVQLQYAQLMNQTGVLLCVTALLHIIAHSKVVFWLMSHACSCTTFIFAAPQHAFGALLSWNRLHEHA